MVYLNFPKILQFDARSDPRGTTFSPVHPERLRICQTSDGDEGLRWLSRTVEWPARPELQDLTKARRSKNENI